MFYHHSLILCAILSLAACGVEPNQSSSASHTSFASENITVSEATSVEPIVINSSDNTVRFTTNDSFSDKLGDTAFTPESASQPTLLQYDDSRNLTVSVVASGKLTGKSPTLFTNLKKAIETDKSITDAHVDTPTATQMSYQFTHSAANNTPAANESCIVNISGAGDIATACATSTDLSQDELKTLLTNSIQFN